MRNKVFGFLLGVIAVVSLQSWAQDWYEASGQPTQRSLISSSVLRTEFASIESDIAAKLPTLTGNGGEMIVVNAGGTALEAVPERAKIMPLVSYQALSASNTFYLRPFNPESVTASEATLARFYPSTELTVTGIQCYVVVGSTHDYSGVVTVRENGSDTAIAVSYSGAETGTKITTGSVVIEVGNYLSVSLVLGAGTGTMVLSNCYLTFQD